MVFTNAQVLELPVAAARQLASQLNRQEARQRQQEQHRLQRTKNGDKVAPGQANKNDKMSKSTAVLSNAAAAATNASAGAASATAGAAADATPAAAGVSTTVESAPTATADEPSMEIIDAKNTEAAAAASMDTSGDTSGTEALGKETGAAAAGPASSPTVQGFDAADGDINEVGGADDAVMQEVESALLPSLSVVSAVPRAVGCGGGSDSRAGSSCSTTTTGNKRRATTNVSTSNTGNTASSSTPPKVKVNKEVCQRSVVAEGVATVCVFKISAGDEPNRPYFGFSAAQAFHAMFKRVCEARREALLQLVQAHTAQHSAPAPAAAAPKDKAPIAETSQAAAPARAASEGANDDDAPDAVSGTGQASKPEARRTTTTTTTTASSLTAQKDARAWLEPRVFGRRSAFASFGLTPAQWFGFGVALVQRRLEALPCVADLAVLPKLPPPSFIANARAAAAAAAAATTTPTAAAFASGAIPLSPTEVVATAEAAAATAAAAAWPPRYRCRFVKPTSDAVLSAVRALAARDARVKPNPSGCARAESRSNVASATARSKRVTRELHSGGGDGGSSSSGSGASGAAARGARKGARAKTAGSGGGDGEDTNRGSRSGLHVRNDSSSDEVCVCVVVFSVGTKRAIIGNTKQCLNFFFVLHAYTLQRCLRCYNCFPVYFLIALFP